MDFRTFVDQLDAEDELLWIKKAVDPVYELGALLKQAEARRKAIWFEQVKGAAFPAVGAVMSHPTRHALSIGHSPRQLAEPGGWSAAVAEARARPLQANATDTGPCREVITTDPNLTTLPVPKFFTGDTHRFITAGLGIAMDPETGIQNVGFYRAPLIDATKFSVSAGGTSRLKQIYQAAARRQKTMPIACIVGAPPALLITAGCRINRDESDMDIAGALQGKAMELVKCQTSDLLVPASAEFVIEAEVLLDEHIDHTMGEFPDQYGVTRSPIARVTAITHRRNAVFHTILGGMNREHNSLGSYIFLGLREQLLQQLQAEFPELCDLHVDLAPRRSGGRCQIAASTDVSKGARPAELIDAIYASTYDSFPLDLIAQRVVLTDTDVNIRSHDDVEWAISMRADEQSRFRVFETPARGGGTTVRLGIDATLNPERSESCQRPVISGADDYPLDRYL